MPTATATQKQQEGANAWPGWEIEVLHDLGAPPNQNNINFLDAWQTFEHSQAHNNPLNITAPAGTGSINSAGVQSYATRQQGAKYTANLIQSGYPTIYGMLKAGDLKSVLFNSDKLNSFIDELDKWGSHNF